MTALYYRFPLNSTGCWVGSMLVVPPFDCQEKVNWFENFATINFSVYFGAHLAKFAHDLIVIQFVDRFTQVKNDGRIVHFGSLKGDGIRYREGVCFVQINFTEHRRCLLCTDQLYRTYMTIYSESCPVAVVSRVTAIYRAIIHRFIWL